MAGLLTVKGTGLGGFFSETEGGSGGLGGVSRASGDEGFSGVGWRGGEKLSARGDITKHTDAALLVPSPILENSGPHYFVKITHLSLCVKLYKSLRWLAHPQKYK